MTTRLAFDLPPALEASEPPEARGIARDGVRLMVASRSTGDLQHTTFDSLPEHLDPGDLVVINTSATIPAAIDGLTCRGERVAVHLSTELAPDRWVVEVRHHAGASTERWSGSPPCSEIIVGEGASLTLLRPYLGDRLWEAELSFPQPALAWLAVNGRPIRYSYVEQSWPLSEYQNVYATEPGSAEMPSAGRPFSHELMTRLVARGIGVTPVVLHTGVASLEADETPYPERVRVPEVTAQRVNRARSEGHRVIAVGTTAVRALESASAASGDLVPYDGRTDLVITPERGVRAVDGLITGWHEPEASHLLMLEAIAGRPLLEASYEASLAAGYLWHEFGDSHLIVP